VSINEAVAETMHLVPHSYAGRHCAENRAGAAAQQIRYFIRRGWIRLENDVLHPGEVKRNITELVIGSLIKTGECDCSELWAGTTVIQARRVLKRLGWIPEDSTGCKWQFIGPSDATVQQFTKARSSERRKRP